MIYGRHFKSVGGLYNKKKYFRQLNSTEKVLCFQNTLRERMTNRIIVYFTNTTRNLFPYNTSASNEIISQ